MGKAAGADYIKMIAGFGADGKSITGKMQKSQKTDGKQSETMLNFTVDNNGASSYAGGADR